MSQSRRPISFIATDDPDQARVFYTDVLGLRLVEASAYALAFADGGHMLRVQIVAEMQRDGHTAHGWQVADIEAEIRDLTARGVQFLRFEPLPQDDLGVWTTPDGHKIAWFHDPSGNILSLTEYVAPSGEVADS